MSIATETGPGPVGTAMLAFITMQVNGHDTQADTHWPHTLKLIDQAAGSIAELKGISFAEAKLAVQLNALHQVVTFSPEQEVASRAEGMMAQLARAATDGPVRMRQQSSRKLASRQPIGRAANHARPLSSSVRRSIANACITWTRRLMAGQPNASKLRGAGELHLARALQKRAYEMQAAGMDREFIKGTLAHLRVSTIEWVRDYIIATHPEHKEVIERFLIEPSA